MDKEYEEVVLYECNCSITKDSDVPIIPYITQNPETNERTRERERGGGGGKERKRKLYFRVVSRVQPELKESSSLGE